MVHMVGRAAARSHAPRMIELEWGDPAHPRMAIVGKGCASIPAGSISSPARHAADEEGHGRRGPCPRAGPAGHGKRLKVRLHLLVPAVENAISGNAFRPGDVLRSRAGISVEIGNTDAEGRLMLGDALARAGEESLSW
jgi:leucyl aminopeptidase